MIYLYTFSPGKCTKDPVCNEITAANSKNSKILKFGKILLDLEKTIQDMSIAYPEQEDNFGLDNNDYWIPNSNCKKNWTQRRKKNIREIDSFLYFTTNAGINQFH